MRAAYAAQDTGHSVIVFEKDAPGGGVVHTGAYAMDELLALAADAGTPSHADLTARLLEMTDQLSATCEHHQLARQLPVVRAPAALDRAEGGTWAVAAAGGRTLCRNVLLATGSVPAIDDVEGVGAFLGSGAVHTERTLSLLADLPERVVVVGGGMRAVQMATYARLCGSEVLIACPEGRLLSEFDEDLSTLLCAAMRQFGLEILLDAHLLSLETDAARLSAPDGERRVSCGLALFGDRRWAAVRGLGLIEHGLALSGGRVLIDSGCRTNLPGVYAAGECAGAAQNVRDAHRDADAALCSCFQLKRPVTRAPGLRCIRRVWSAASVGLTAQAAASQKIRVAEVCLPLPYQEHTVGMIKLLADASNQKLIGAHLAGDGAPALADTLAAAIAEGLRAKDIRLTAISPSAEIAAEALFRLQSIT